MEIKVDLTLSESAIKELKRTKEENELGDETLVRVQVQGGGCSGYMYGLNFVQQDEVNEEEDFVEDHDGIKLVVDRKSLLFLDGTTIDWVEDLNQRGFKFENPNATRSCGCGQSFSA
jgi:iron-sulfur cluster assembly protein